MKGKDPRKGLPSASKMDRIANCPGSLWAEREFSMDDSTEVSQEGDEIHEGLASDNLDELGEDEKVIAENLKRMRNQAITDWLETLSPHVKTKVFKETRFWMKDKTKPVCSAQVDWAELSIEDKAAFVLDYKSGYKPVTASFKNYQVRTQVVCLWEEYPKLERIRGSIAAYRFREHFHYVDYSQTDLVKAKRELLFLIWRAEKRDAERVPGEWCGYCKAKANCRQYAAYGLLPVPLVDSSGKVSDQDVFASISKLTLEELAYLQSKRSLADKLFKAVTNRLRNVPKEDLATVGLKLQPFEITKVNDMGAIFKLFMESGLLEKQECAGCCDLVLGRLTEIAVPRLMQQGVATKKDAVERVKKMLEPHMDKIKCADKVVKLTKKELEDAQNVPKRQRRVEDSGGNDKERGGGVPF